MYYFKQDIKLVFLMFFVKALPFSNVKKPKYPFLS